MNNINKLTSFLLTVVFLIFLTNSSAYSFERRYLGNEDAPVVMYEFISLSCVHCADFTKEVFPQLKTNYVDTGKLKIVFMDVPFGGPTNLYAHSLLYSTKSPEDFFGLAKFLLAEQSKWLETNNPEVLARLYGLSAREVTDAQYNKNLQTWLIEDSKKVLQKLNIEGTPTILLGKKGSTVYNTSVRFDGMTSYDDMAKAIDKLME